MGGLLTTATDYAKFLMEVMDPRPTDAFRLNQAKEMLDQAGFHSLAEFSSTRKSGYVILTNADTGWKLIQELAPEIARWIHTEPPPSEG